MAAPRYLWSAKDLFVRLVARFNLKDNLDQNINLPSLMSPIITPVTIADELLRLSSIKVTTVDVPLGPSDVIMHTVPLGKRWRLLCYEVTKATGTFTFIGLFVHNGTTYVTIDSFTAASSRVDRIDGEVWLEEGWTLKIGVDACAVIGTVTSRLLVREEDAY